MNNHIRHIHIRFLLLLLMKVIIFIALLTCILGQQPEMLEQIAQNSFGK